MASTVPQHLQLQGKFNFYAWQEHLLRQADERNVADLLLGKEPILRDEPTPDQIQGYLRAIGTNDVEFDASSSSLMYNAVVLACADNIKKQQIAKHLLIEHSCPTIQHEIDFEADPASMYRALIDKYKSVDASNAVALIEKARNLKLRHCDNMIDYIDKHKAIKDNLEEVGYSMKDLVLQHNILNGLPWQYSGFKFFLKHLIDTHPNHDLNDDILTKMLLHQEAKLLIDRLEKIGYSCSVPNDTCTRCGGKDHTEAICWRKHPEM